MCGIAGIISKEEGSVFYSELKRMTDAIKHRGPDGEGHWIGSKGKVGFGHRRLSIIDLSDKGGQPMHYLEGRYTITFNGEIYNFVEIKNDLIKRGYKFVSESDTEVLLALYDLKKENCLKDLDGMFAFAIWDEVEKKLFCARDRFGEKPFFYFRDAERFVFASEIKSIFSYGVEKKINNKRLYYYLSFNTVEDPHDNSSTFFSNIMQLEPAHYLIITAEGRFFKNKYWDIDLTVNKNISFEEASNTFFELFQTSIKRRLRSDVPVGSSLSGGLDSSSIVLLINHIKNGSQGQKTFSARFKNFAKDEGEYMQAVIEKANNIEPFFTWPTEETLFNELDKIVYHQEEPFGGASVLAQWEVMKLAKENKVIVLLDGQGADEILVGYLPFYPTYLNQLYSSFSEKYKPETVLLKEFHGIAHENNFNTKFMLRFPSVFNTLSRTKKTIFGKKKSIEKEPEYMKFYSNDFKQELLNYQIPVLQENNDHLGKSQKNIIQKNGLQSLLRFADRNSMAFSRELRLPFLSHELAEYVFTLPEEFKLNRGWTKYILRDTMKNYLPEKIAWRKDKIGYEPPQKKWLENKKSEELLVESKKVLDDYGIFSKQANDLDDWKCLSTAKFLTTWK